MFSQLFGFEFNGDTIRLRTASDLAPGHALVVVPMVMIFPPNPPPCKKRKQTDRHDLRQLMSFEKNLSDAGRTCSPPCFSLQPVACSLAPTIAIGSFYRLMEARLCTGRGRGIYLSCFVVDAADRTTASSSTHRRCIKLLHFPHFL
jgi:hypothetical protein